MWLEFPTDAAGFAIDDQWMVGDALLVKPVTAEGAVSADVYFPGATAGTLWYDAVTLAPRAAAPAPVTEAFVAPAFLCRQEPAYPERARRAGAEGVVGVRLALAADGSVRAVELTRSSGSRLLDEAALAAARASTFTPASRNHAPVAAEAEASYRFELR